MSENKSVFREKSLERINSPEQLNDYIKVANPGVWAVLIGVIILLAGLCVWGIFGRLESAIEVPVVADKGTVILYIADRDIASVAKDMEIAVEGITVKLTEIGTQPVKASTIGNEYMLYVGSFAADEWIYPCTLEVGHNSLSDGVYKAKLVTESIAPITFFTN